jgi:hypothetical protein
MEIRAENGVIREQLRKLEEQQRTLLQLVDELQRRLDGRSAPIASQSSPPALPAQPDPRRLRPLRRHNLAQIETLPRKIPTKTVSFW